MRQWHHRNLSNLSMYIVIHSLFNIKGINLFSNFLPVHIAKYAAHGLVVC